MHLLRQMQQGMSGGEYTDGRWSSGLGETLHPLHGLPAHLSAEGDTIQEDFPEEGTISLGRLFIACISYTFSFNKLKSYIKVD